MSVRSHEPAPRTSENQGTTLNWTQNYGSKPSGVPERLKHVAFAGVLVLNALGVALLLNMQGPASFVDSVEAALRHL
jgi:hypothetical protein